MRNEFPENLPVGTSVFPASDTRPEGYPADLPFVPGVACVTHDRTNPKGEPVRVCTWMAADEEPGAMDAYRAMLEPLQEKLQEIPLVGRIARLIGEGDARSPADTPLRTAELRQLVDEAPPEERAAMFEFERTRQEALRPTAEIADAAERVGGAVVEQSVEQGWKLVGEQSLFPSGTVMVKLRRAGRSRAVTRMAAAFGGHVMLMETAARDG